MRRQFTSVGPLAAASATNIRSATGATAAGALTLSGALVTGGVATMDKPRRVWAVTSGTELSTLTLVGTTFNGTAATENIALGATGGYTSVLDYATLTSASISVGLTGTLSLGTTGTAGSSWVSFDDWINAPAVAFQITAAGTVNYTVQQTMDDPNYSTSTGVTAMQPQNMTWLNCSDSAAVSATGSIQSNYQFAPVWARVVVNSGATGTSSVTATFRQVGK